MEILTDKTQLAELGRLNRDVYQRLMKNAKLVENPGQALEKPAETRETRHADIQATPENIAEVDKAVKILEIFEPHHPETRFQYSVHSDTGTIQIRLVNKSTGEVVEEIPSSKMLDFNARLEELTGLVLEKRA